MWRLSSEIMDRIARGRALLESRLSVWRHERQWLADQTRRDPWQEPEQPPIEADPPSEPSPSPPPTPEPATPAAAYAPQEHSSRRTSSADRIFQAGLVFLGIGLILLILSGILYLIIGWAMR